MLPCRAWPAGGVATFVVRYRRGGALPVTFEATADGGPISQPLVLTLPEREEHHRFVASFWARARVLELLRHHPTGPKDPNRAEIVELSLAHRFMTPYTAFLSLPDAERRRLLLGPMPPDDAAAMLSFSKFAGGAPEAEVWLLIAIGLITAVAVARRRTPTVQGGLS